MDISRLLASEARNLKIGFIGLGSMGHPIAMNMAHDGLNITVWNRSSGAVQSFISEGISVADSSEEIFEKNEVIFLMLSSEEALDSLLMRGTNKFCQRVSGKVIVSMGSNNPAYSISLGREIAAANGQYIESPVSGSRKPAEEGKIAVLLGGDVRLTEYITPLLRAVCSRAIYCGEVGSAMKMKLAVNLYLNTMLAALSEAVHFASVNGLNLKALEEVIDAGPMSCDVTRVKLRKLVERDFSVQAASSDSWLNTKLIKNAAVDAGVSIPLGDVTRSLFGENIVKGNGHLDMMSVIQVLEAYTEEINSGKTDK